MKWSLYNIIVEDNDTFLLYNSRVNKVLIILLEIKILLEKYKNEIDNIKLIHPDLYEALLTNKFIVQNDIDEARDFLNGIYEYDNAPEYFHLIINPTLDCNLRCWYCYEKHQKNSIVNAVVENAIRLFIKNKIQEKHLKRFTLSFFGGEPLMRFQKEVLPLILYTKKLSDEYKVILNVTFTTNATLLTPKVSDCLSSIEIEVHFQVPIDGNNKSHDKIKSYYNGKGTYKDVINNIKYALYKGSDITIRCNYTNDNILDFKNVIDEFSEYSDTKKVRFSMQKIWQEAQTEQIHEKVNEIIRYLKRKKFLYDEGRIMATRCYADKENSMVINYNGDIFKCTANDFLPELREGRLNPDGSITFNNQYQMRMNAKYKLGECLNCAILPICQSCSQDRLRMLKGGECRYKNDKLELVKDQIKLIAFE